MRSPFSPLYFLLFIFALGFLLAFVQIGIVTIAFDKLGLSQGQAMLLLFASLFGSAINLPLFSIKAERPPDMDLPPLFRSVLKQTLPFTGKTIIAVNVGGCLIPLVFSLHLIRYNPVGPMEILLAIAVVAAICHAASRPIAGIGIGLPIFVAPVTAAVVAVLINHEYSAPLAYIAGTLGVLIGADILHLKDVRRLGAPMASIGGAGTFDGIFLTGIVAVLLA